MLQNIKASFKESPRGTAFVAVILFAVAAFALVVGCTSFQRSSAHDFADLFLAVLALLGALQFLMWTLQGMVRAVEWLDGLFQ